MRTETILVCEPMPNVMAALPNIGGKVWLIYPLLHCVSKSSHRLHVCDFVKS